MRRLLALIGLVITVLGMVELFNRQTPIIGDRCYFLLVTLLMFLFVLVGLDSVIVGLMVDAAHKPECRSIEAKEKKNDKLTNKRKDIRHKLVGAVVSNYRYVAFQDESIAGWKASGHGKKVQFSGIGSILADLKHKAVAPLEVDKFLPSTKLCTQCGKKNAPTLADRVYECECGYNGGKRIAIITINNVSIKLLLFGTDLYRTSYERISIQPKPQGKSVRLAVSAFHHP
jgi:hypothetical protein